MQFDLDSYKDVERLSRLIAALTHEGVKFTLSKSETSDRYAVISFN